MDYAKGLYVAEVLRQATELRTTERTAQVDRIKKQYDAESAATEIRHWDDDNHIDGFILHIDQEIRRIVAFIN